MSGATTAYCLAYEMEIALLVCDIHQHITALTKTEHVARLERRTIIRQPVGVSLIYAADGTSMKYMLASLAASLAAGNVTILATGTAASNPLLSLLLDLWPRYLDPDSVFLLPEFSVPQLNAADVDKIMVHDKSPGLYSSILTWPHVEFHDTSTALNLAIVTGHVGNLGKTMDEIAFMSSTRVLPSDRLHAIIASKEQAQGLEQALSKSCLGQAPMSEDRDAPESKSSVTLVGSMQSGLETALRSIEDTSPLMILAVTSLERALDGLLNLKASIQQLAVVGSEAEKTATYAGAWLPVRNLFIGSIYPAALAHASWSTSPLPWRTLFSMDSFSRVVVVHGAEVAQPMYTAKEIRARYETMVPTLAADPSGERLGFFTQVEYVLKGVGATLGLATVLGVVYGMRRFRR
ncbi:hypothetical protein NX059_003481 [Plenodomus lindquistii]|nr:hypothetical protein NX059_003481 [Plenodomus lindquistii]